MKILVTVTLTSIMLAGMGADRHRDVLRRFRLRLQLAT